MELRPALRHERQLVRYDLRLLHNGSAQLCSGPGPRLRPDQHGSDREPDRHRGLAADPGQVRHRDTLDTRDTTTSIDPKNNNVGDLLNAKGTTWGWFHGGFADCAATDRNIGGVSSAGLHS